MSSKSDFVSRHIGPGSSEQAHMLEALGLDSLDALLDSVVPDSIRHRQALDLDSGVDEATALAELMFLKIRPGIPPTRPISRRLHRAGWKCCSIFRR